MMSSFTIWLRLRGLRCNHLSSVACQIFLKTVIELQIEIIDENSILIIVLNQQYLIILTYVMSVIHILQADSIEAIYFELNRVKYFHLTELRWFLFFGFLVFFLNFILFYHISYENERTPGSPWPVTSLCFWNEKYLYRSRFYLSCYLMGGKKNNCPTSRKRVSCS